MEKMTMGPGRRLAWLILAAAHLGVVTLGALKVSLHGGGWGRRAVHEYARLSGADSFYTFFSSDAGAQLRPVFQVTDRAGAVSADVLERPLNREADIRVANLVSLFWWDDEEFQYRLVGSWAHHVLARHPGATQVVVRTEAYHLPSMKEYREGQRPEWRRLDQSTFSRQDALRAAGGGDDEARR
jgi:hypothetical protein